MIALLILVLAFSLAVLVHNLNLASFLLILFALLAIFIASQVFWIGRTVDLGERLLPAKPRRRQVAIAVDLLFLFILAYSFPTTLGQGHTFRIGFYRLPGIVTEAVFWWWFVASILGFVLVIAFGAADRAAHAAAWLYGKGYQTARGRGGAPDPAADAPDPTSPGRRRFLEQTAVLVSATPFVAAGYGLLYERLDVEVVRQRIRLPRLPKPFEGFRIAQLSEIHMGPYATADYVGRCVAITNSLKPDLIALTGDYIAWDPGAEGEVVRVLAGLRALHGVFGCLGNHESESETEGFITPLFTAQGMRILRQERTPMRLGGEELNLIGIDDPRGKSEAGRMRDLYRRLHKGLVMPDTVNILLAHEPSEPMFDRAAALGIDLILSGHTHGGQLSLDFLHGGVNISHVVYPYTGGWYEKRGARLYVNRGIGTTVFPIRLGARPEITLFELVRRA